MIFSINNSKISSFTNVLQSGEPVHSAGELVAEAWAMRSDEVHQHKQILEGKRQEVRNGPSEIS